MCACARVWSLHAFRTLLEGVRSCRREEHNKQNCCFYARSHGNVQGIEQHAQSTVVVKRSTSALETFLCSSAGSLWLLRCSPVLSLHKLSVAAGRRHDCW